ncbi:MAG: hypothetical protein HOY71_44360 [Nonomuraea sp.]|nr:hypothetical protein [Nonomuraea sp.]
MTSCAHSREISAGSTSSAMVRKARSRPREDASRLSAGSSLTRRARKASDRKYSRSRSSGLRGQGASPLSTASRSSESMCQARGEENGSSVCGGAQVHVDQPVDERPACTPG